MHLVKRSAILRIGFFAAVFFLEASAGEIFGSAQRAEGVGKFAMAVAQEGDRLYVAADDELVVLDVADPLQPRRLGAVRGVDNRRQLVVRDGLVYLVSRETGLRIIDCTDPTAPRIRTRYDSVEFATGIDLAGNVAFLSERINGVEFVDITNPDRPAHIAMRKTGESQSNRYRDGYLYSGEWGAAQVTVFDAHDMRNIREIGSLNLKGFGDGLEISGDYLYCSTGHDARHRPEWTGKEAVGRGRGMEIFSLANPAKPVFVGRVDFPRFIPRNDDYWTVRVSDGVAYCADSHNGLFAVDVHDPAQPKVVDRFCVPQANKPDWPSAAVSSLAVGRGCLYVTVSPGGLFVIPIAGLKPEPRPKGVLPRHPDYREPYGTDASEFVVYKPNLPGQARTAVVRGNLVYAAFGDAGLKVLKVGETGGFEPIGELTGRKVYDCCFCGDKLVCAEGLDGFAVYDLKGPATFVERQRRMREAVAFWCWAPDDKTVVLTGRSGGRFFVPIDDICAQSQVTIYGTCQWDKYLADRAVDGVLPELIPYVGMQWTERTKDGWRLRSRPRHVDPDDPRVAGQTCGICTFGDRFIATSSNAGSADGRRTRKPALSLVGKDGTYGPFIPLAGGIDGVPRSDGRLLALNNRSCRVLALYDMAEPTQPKLLKKWSLSGNPDLCAFYRGRVIIPAGHQGLLMTVRSFAEKASASRAELRIDRPAKAREFGGFGFQHSEASMTALMTDEFRDERVLKTFAELMPSFGRVYIGFADMSREAMDRFADYYDLTFRKAGTDLYAVPCAMVPEFPEKSDPDAYAEKVANGLDYLIKVRKCDRIRFYCLTNELVVNGKWNWFERSGNLPLYKTYNVALHKAFRRHNLDITLLGTDVAVTLKPYDALKSLAWAAENMDDILGIYCSHWYVYARKTEDLGLWNEYLPYFDRLVALAEAKGKHFLLGEWGFHPAWGRRGVMIDDVKPYWRCPSNRTETVLAKMEVGLAAMNKGAYACVNWSFVDYPDPWIFEDGDSSAERAAYESAKCVWTPDFKYNKCGLFSWGSVDLDYSSCEELYAMGYLTKLFRRGATVLEMTTSDPMLRAGAVVNPDGSVSVAVINRGGPCAVALASGLPLVRPMRRYVYEADAVPWSDFNDLQPCSGLVAPRENKLEVELPARSMTFLTTDYVDRKPEPVAGVHVAGDAVVWKASADPHLAYYRVYCNGRQVASTVALRTKAADPKGSYSVRVVDRWGNEGR